jgi:hypothetical protein
VSYEHFETIMCADVRTAADLRTVEYAEPGAGTGVRWPEDRIGWVTCALYAHDAIELAARAVQETPMDGISGDYPEHRAQAAAVIRAAGNLARVLAADAACDGQLTDAAWERALYDVVVAAS